MKFFSDLIGYTLLCVQQNLRNELKYILGLPELTRTFGLAKLVPGSDLRSQCPTGLTVRAVLDFGTSEMQNEDTVIKNSNEVNCLEIITSPLFCVDFLF